MIMKKRIFGPNYVTVTNPHSVAMSGRRKDLGDIFFRSKAEANYARYLNFLRIKWQYEPKTFDFAKIRRGCVSYKPDFYLPEEDRWIEVKGWFDAKSKTKLKRFKIYYPEEYKKLTVVLQSRKAIGVVAGLGIPYEDYRKIARQVKEYIVHWEH